MTKKIFFGISIALLGIVVGTATISMANPKKMLQRASADNQITLDSSHPLSGLPSSYQNDSEVTATTPNGNTLKLNVVNGKTSAGNLIELANRGMIYNFGYNTSSSRADDAITGLSSVTANFTGALSIKTARFGQAGGVELGEAQTLTSGSELSLTTSKYFQLTAGDGGAVINSLILKYSCTAGEYDIKNLNGTYTGEGTNGYTYKLVLNNGSATINSLDMAVASTFTGTGSMTSASELSLSLKKNNTLPVTYVCSISADGQVLSYVSKTGAGASQISEIDFYKVYTVENFESYTKTGDGYVSAATKYTTTGLRAEYYADYYTGSSSGEIGGSGWPIMTSTDNSNYNSQKGHNSSKVGIFKFSNNMGMRYISMNELYGVKSVIGKGTTLSVWARGAYTNANFNTDHASDTPMKMYAFYGTPLTPSTQTTVRESFDFTVSAGSTWQHFEFDLTPGRIYYGFGFYAKQTSGSTQYVPLDDIEIYTYSPYATYVAPVSVTGVSVSPTALELFTGGNSSLTATVSPNDATNKNVSWSSSNTSVATVANDGTVHAVAPGNATITVTTEDGGYTATCAVTVSAPATYYPEGTYKGTATISSYSADLVLAFGNASNGLIGVRVSNTDMIPGAVSYNTANNTFSITTSGTATFGSYSFTTGTITGTYDYANDRLTNINCSGTIGSYVSNLTATKPTANYWDCDGTTSQLQSLFKRRYMSGSWQVDNSNADRITSNTTEFVSGTGAVKRRGYSGGAVALNFNSDFSPAITVKNVHFWVYNPSGSNITLRMWGYKANNFGSNFETGSVTAIAGQWTYVAMGFTSASIYNWQIADFNNTGTYLTFDNIYLF